MWPPQGLSSQSLTSSHACWMWNTLQDTPLSSLADVCPALPSQPDSCVCVLIPDLLRRSLAGLHESCGSGLCQGWEKQRGERGLRRGSVRFLFSFLELCPSYYEFFREMKCSSSLKKSWTLSSSKRALESVYKLSPLVAVRKAVDSIMGFWRGRHGLCALFDVANTEPSGTSGKRMFCSLGKEKINLKCELKFRSSAGLRCTRDEFACFNGNILCLVAEVGKCFCKDLVGEVICVCL